MTSAKSRPNGHVASGTPDISAAAKWLATTPQHGRPHPIVPHLRKRFGLSPIQAVQAIREADLIKARAL